MKPITAADPQSRSADLMADNIARLRELFPEAFTAGKIDFDVLKQLLGGEVEEREEKYGLNWHGKRRARRLALTPSNGTLRPAPEDSVDWSTTRNVFIEGDNLEVLKLLQKSYSGKVKLIYIDPPYNTGNDFVYEDDFRDSIDNYKRITGQINAEGHALTSNPETSGRFHTNWLNMLYPRLYLARQLLRDDGVIFVSIDDHEVHHLRAMMNEVFGEESFVASVIWEKADSPRNSARQFSEDHDYVLAFSKRPDWTPDRLPRTEEANSIYSNPDNDANGPWLPGDPYANHYYSKGQYTITGPTGREFKPPHGRYWRISEDRFRELDAAGRIWWGPTRDARPSIKRYLSEVADLVPRTLWKKDDVGSNRTSKNEMRNLFPEAESFDTPKPTKLVQRLLQLATSSTEGDYVLDFFAGSGTTAHAVMAQNSADGGNRHFILVQLPEPLQTGESDQNTAAGFCDQLGKPRTIAELTKERLRRAGKKVKSDTPLFTGDTGFRAYKLDASNIRPWNPKASDIGKSLFDAVDHLEAGREEPDILTELLLKFGLDLCIPIQPKTIAGSTVHSIGGGVLLVCLATKIAAKQVEPLAQGIVAWHKEQNPAGESQVVFRDSAFDNDVAKTNMTAILAQHGLTNVRSL
jgi:adenine-specific DNA-methyltransferase